MVILAYRRPKPRGHRMTLRSIDNGTLYVVLQSQLDQLSAAARDVKTGSIMIARAIAVARCFSDGRVG